jgi:hypothetical protein
MDRGKGGASWQYKGEGRIFFKNKKETIRGDIYLLFYYATSVQDRCWCVDVRDMYDNMHTCVTCVPNMLCRAPTHAMHQLGALQLVGALHEHHLQTLLGPVSGSFMRTLISLSETLGFFVGLVQNRFHGGS